jgi:hypothetical protein
MSGSLPISNPMMLPRGNFRSAVRAHRAASAGVAVSRLRSRISLTWKRFTIWLTWLSHDGVNSYTHSGISLFGDHTA